MHPVLLAKQVAVAQCLALSSTDVERARGTASLLPVKEILFEVSEPKANCWCMAC